MSNCLEVSRNLRLCAGAEEYEQRIKALEDVVDRLSGKACLLCGLRNDSKCPNRNDEMSPCTFDPNPVHAAQAFMRRARTAEAKLEKFERIPEKKSDWKHRSYQEGYVHGWNALNDIIRAILRGEADG